MKYIVIGASSFIGSNLYNYFNKKDFPVIGTRNQSNNSKLYKFELGRDAIENILDLNMLGKEGACAIICSAITSIDWCYLNEKKSYNVNVVATKELIKILNLYGIKCVFLSSEAVFDGKKEGYYTELDQVNPVTVYGKQKVEIEEYILQNHKSNTIVRISRAISDKYCINEHCNDLLSSFWKNCLEMKPILCIRNQSFTPTYVMDLVKSILICIENNLNGIYHISNNELYTRAELALKFCEFYELECEIKEMLPEEIGCKDARHIYTGLNAKKFVDKTGMMFTSVDEVIKRYR